MSAELLAEYVARLGTQKKWLWEFDRERQRMLRDYHLVTQMVLWVADHPRLAKGLLSALKNSPAIFSHLVGVSGGVRRLFAVPAQRTTARTMCLRTNSKA